MRPPGPLPWRGAPCSGPGHARGSLRGHDPPVCPLPSALPVLIPPRRPAGARVLRGTGRRGGLGVVVGPHSRAQAHPPRGAAGQDGSPALRPGGRARDFRLGRARVPRPPGGCGAAPPPAVGSHSREHAAPAPRLHTGLPGAPTATGCGAGLERSRAGAPAGPGELTPAHGQPGGRQRGPASTPRSRTPVGTERVAARLSAPACPCCSRSNW